MQVGIRVWQLAGWPSEEGSWLWVRVWDQSVNNATTEGGISQRSLFSTFQRPWRNDQILAGMLELYSAQKPDALRCRETVFLRIFNSLCVDIGYSETLPLQQLLGSLWLKVYAILYHCISWLTPIWGPPMWDAIFQGNFAKPCQERWSSCD